MIHRTHRSARLHTLRIAVTAGVVSGCLVLGVPGATSATADAGWGPAQEGPPYRGHAQVVAFPDGTLVALSSTTSTDGLGGIVRSTRSRAESWTPAEQFPVAEDVDLHSVAIGPGGTLHVSYERDTGSGAAYEVRAWHHDGSVGEVTLSNAAGPYVLHADDAGDVVAARTTRNDGRAGFVHRLRYLDGATWHALPTIGVGVGDLVVPGPGDSVWLVSYDRPDNTLRVRRWVPGMAAWDVEWARDYPPGHPNDPFVAGMDFAVGRAGRAVLAFHERPAGRTPATVRVVRRVGRAGWTSPNVLQRVALDRGQVVTGPVVAAVGAHSAVAWTTSAQRGSRRRVVRLAAVGDHRPQVRRLAIARTFRGAWDLSLDVDVRAGGDVLTTYVERQGERRDLVAWLGPHDAPVRTTLLEGVASAWTPVTSALVPGLAAVVSAPDDGPLVSRVWES